MKSKSMRFRWFSNLKKWVVNNLCCVVKKKNIKRHRCKDLESSVVDKSCDLTAIDLSTITSADPPFSSHADLETEMSKVKLDDLNIVTPLGFGGFGRVMLVQVNCYSKETYALKIINKNHIVAIGEQARVLNERDIMTKMRSDFIVRLHKTFKDDDHLYMLMEPCLGGELFTLLSEGKNLSHTAAKFYTACIAEAFSFMHSKGIVHRDLKPENVLLDSKGYAKLIDFGMAKKLKRGKKTRTICGSPNYIAPEIILKEGHGTAADIWSLGVLVFAMLTGRSLFKVKQDNGMHTRNNILKGINDFVFPNEIQEIAEDFIRRLCRNDPDERLTAQKISKHGWFNEFRWEDLRDRTMEPPFIPKVESSADTRNFACERYRKEADYPRIDDAISWDPDF
ncbi:hypothetical protein ACJMK2_006220 [Sinanodonta woodiana]|uniref:Uncharacterized protein n=1 Tax=Sinanodonta woodiana TaxID=1069815 RepID=A0ABD3VV97_SINWO